MNKIKIQFYRQTIGEKKKKRKTRKEKNNKNKKKNRDTFMLYILYLFDLIFTPFELILASATMNEADER